MEETLRRNAKKELEEGTWIRKMEKEHVDNTLRRNLEKELEEGP